MKSDTSRMGRFVDVFRAAISVMRFIKCPPYIRQILRVFLGILPETRSSATRYLVQSCRVSN